MLKLPNIITTRPNSKMTHNYEVGTRAWQPEPTEGWVASELISKTETATGFDLVFKLENGEVRWLKDIPLFDLFG